MLQKRVYKNTIEGRVTRVLHTLKNIGEEYATIADKMGYSPVHISRIATGKQDANGVHATKLAAAYPELNLNYMLEGEGDVFKTDELTLVDKKQGYFPVQKLPKQLAIYDLDVQAGSMPLFDDVSKDPIESIGFLGSEQCDFAVKVHGESMSPKIVNGGIIAVKEIHDLEIIPFGHIFLIFTNDLRMVKYIRKSKENESIKLCSHNHDYEDFEIPRHKIKRLFIVKRILNDES